MINWLKALLRRHNQESDTSAMLIEDDTVKRFRSLLKERMNEKHASICDAFTALFRSELPDAAKSLHIEVFLDDPAFYFHIFSMDENNCQTPEPPSVAQTNQELKVLWPIVTEEEADEYTIWEDDPNWGRQVALEQPLDSLDKGELAIAWLKMIVSETRGDFLGNVTASVHDSSIEKIL